MEKNKYNQFINDDVESGGEEGGGLDIQFHDFLTGKSTDQVNHLSLEEIKAKHSGINLEQIKKQKEKRDAYDALRNNQISLEAHREGYGRGFMHETTFEVHPLSKTAQFSGIDSKMNAITNKNTAETNSSEKENKLKAQPSFRKQLQQAPVFIPPKLTR